MSLYFDAEAILTAPSTGGSFKSRIYSARNLRASPAQIYALITEASKWDRVLAEVIERADILALERKLSPLLALLLVHDFLLSKNGIAAPAAHPIRQAIERHKTRLKAEFVKARVRRGCASIEALKTSVLREKRQADGKDGDFVYPRWVRINNICTTLEDQLRTTFASYERVQTLAALSPNDPDSRTPEPRLYIDPNIPDLVAVPYGIDFTSSAAYKNGEIILQDKASCFPAYLLLGDMRTAWKGDLVDGCAAPGNKTTHMASLLAKRKPKTKAKNHIFSMDASTPRSKTLQKMVALAKADSIVTVLPGQDFLALDPADSRFEHVSGLLLDPSCSGSGIIGRDDVPQLTLPAATASKTTNTKSATKKRKRQADDESEDLHSKATTVITTASTSTTDENDIPGGAIDHERLTKLSNLQARIVEHALSFPNATHVTYSTCSIHLIENEAVVSRVLASEVAQRRGWRLLRRDEQPDGLRRWRLRGVRQENNLVAGPSDTPTPTVDLSDEDLESCLRCWPGDVEGLGGFFVAGFVCDPSGAEERPALTGTAKGSVDDNDDDHDDDEWEGFSD
ncbi:hypothetical protein N7474_004594 [Penicillium riverlandense]|uniref:uncharacterized protein n=1 Tax=Penicillium riverlandense TaxID=1903569 RepID=UPI00254727B1|nr:uncharacterized protein N7474_004594 [Penicillium riverlandense]KAJ5819003.1 hypothetical protein N7474_004594 [Penicillium riverlandense]